jgi:hypothetical protein
MGYSPRFKGADLKKPPRGPQNAFIMRQQLGQPPPKPPPEPMAGHTDEVWAAPEQIWPPPDSQNPR